MVNVEVLKSVPLFAALSPMQLAALATCVTLKRYPRGAPILMTGQTTGALYVMQSGRAKVFESHRDGREVILSIMERGDFFGEMALLDDLPCSASVEALVVCELIRISKADFTSCLSGSFDLMRRIMLALVARLRHADRQIESLALLDVYGRVARLLLDMAEISDGKYTIAELPSPLNLSRMVGSSREMVSHVLRELKASGHILMDKRRVVLLDKLGTRRRS